MVEEAVEGLFVKFLVLVLIIIFFLPEGIFCQKNLKYEDSLSALSQKNEDSLSAWPVLEKHVKHFDFSKAHKVLASVLGLGRSIGSGTPKKFGITCKLRQDKS